MMYFLFTEIIVLLLTAPYICMLGNTTDAKIPLIADQYNTNTWIRLLANTEYK